MIFCAVYPNKSEIVKNGTLYNTITPYQNRRGFFISKQLLINNIITNHFQKSIYYLLQYIYNLPKIAIIIKGDNMIYELNEKIKNLRINSGMNQVQLAERLGITKSAVNAWESGTNSPSLSYIVKLARIFGVSTDFLLGVNERLTVDISGLDDMQRQAVLLMINLFKRNYGLTSQKDIDKEP